MRSRRSVGTGRVGWWASTSGTPNRCAPATLGPEPPARRLIRPALSESSSDRALQRRLFMHSPTAHIGSCRTAPHWNHGCSGHARPRPICPPPACKLPPPRAEHRPFHEHLGSANHGGFGGLLELWRLLMRLNELARESERIHQSSANGCTKRWPAAHDRCETHDGSRGGRSRCGPSPVESGPGGDGWEAERPVRSERLSSHASRATERAYSGGLSRAGRMVDVMM